MEKILEVHNVSKSYKDFSLKPLSFSLEPGYILGVIGENGAGKSTLMNLVLGTVTLGEDARIYVDGYNLCREKVKAKERIAYVLNDCPFAMGITVEDNARIFGENYETFSIETFHRYCEKYEIPLKKNLIQLSKGERIRFQLAFARSYDAKLYIMDEPAGNLDIIFRQELLDAMQEIVEAGDKSVIYVTHLTEDLDQIGDYILWLHKGEMLFYGTRDEIVDQYLILQATEKQLKYIRQRKPQMMMVENVREYVSEALVRMQPEQLPLKVDFRRPTLEELLYYYDLKG